MARKYGDPRKRQAARKAEITRRSVAAKKPQVGQHIASEKRFLGFIIMRGMMQPLCYNVETKKWKRDPTLSTYFPTVTEAEAVIASLAKYGKTAEIRILTTDGRYYSSGSLSWSDLKEYRDSEQELT